jgi:AraC family transcriptional regulator
MEMKTLKIGNMCCGRCITAVTSSLDQLGIKHKKVDLGYALIYDDEELKEGELKAVLKKSGFNLIKSKEEEISEKIKIVIHKLFMDIEKRDLGNINLREYLETEIQMPYKAVSEIFSTQNKKTIEKYFILYRIEKAKIFITDSNHSFSEIAFKLGYSSLSHLSKQFKELEGVSMSSYKLKPKNNRKHLDKI